MRLRTILLVLALLGFLSILAGGWLIYLLYTKELIDTVCTPLLHDSGLVVLILPVLIGSAVLLLYRAASQEIAGRKRAEEALRESEEKFRAVVSQSKDGIFLVDTTQWRIQEANPALGHMLGCSHGELLNLRIDDFISPRTQSTAQDLRHAVEQDHHFIGNLRFVTRSQQLLDLEASANLITYGGQQVLSVLCRDVTERRRLEEELVKAQKLESLGVLAGGIAHDFNNILTAVIGNLSLSKLLVRPEDKIHKRLEETEKACLRAKELTQQLLTFARGGAPIKRILSMTDTIHDSVVFALRGSNVRCEFAMAEDLWPLEVDEGQISQVIHNLVINAAQAMPDGGTIALCTGNVEIDPSQRLPLPPGRYVKISIQDSGSGIAREHLSKVFDPYFTTKPGGSGIGLATAYSIVKRHEGLITVKSEPGCGSCFDVYLPASSKKLPAQGSLKSEPALPLGACRILVMDDEELVRDVVVHMLHHLGCHVTLAQDGAEAIELFVRAATRKEPFNAVILDLTVPGGLGGKETVRRLRQMDATVKAFVSSGYSNDPVMADYRAHGFDGVVSKPFKIEELSEVLRAVIPPL